MKARKRILFVDDDLNVLDGLRNVLRPERHEWEMVFALGPEKALALLAEQRFDVVITDMRMPQMDGATLLTEVKRLQPHAVRMVLTGQTEQESVMKSVFIAHISLAKPCEHELLKSVVSRACNLNSLLQSDELRAAVGQVEMLPAVPHTYVALNQAISRPNCGVKDLARIIEQDVGLCAKILQLVNSAFFGLSRKTGCLSEAITYLGTETIKAIALALEAFSGSPGAAALSLDELAELQRHSVLTGQIARRLVSRERENTEETFLAGMLHDVGWLIHVPPGTASDLAFDRALLGAYLLGLWGLPHSIIEAVAYHRAPRMLPHSKWEMVDIIHVAHHLAAELRGGQDGQGLDLEHLQTLGVSSERIQQWRLEIEEASRQAAS